jgi:predicted nucleic acid-binding protein
MTRYVVDSWAWLEYLDGSVLGEKVRESIADEKNEIFTHVLSLVEIMSKVRRKEKDTNAAWRAIVTNSRIFTISEVDSKEVGLLHAEIRAKQPSFGLADAFVLSAARKLGGKVLTGDPDFAHIEDAAMLS